MRTPARAHVHAFHMPELKVCSAPAVRGLLGASAHKLRWRGSRYLEWKQRRKADEVMAGSEVRVARCWGCVHVKRCAHLPLHPPFKTLRVGCRHTSLNSISCVSGALSWGRTDVELVGRSLPRRCARPLGGAPPLEAFRRRGLCNHGNNEQTPTVALRLQMKIYSGFCC